MTADSRSGPEQVSSDAEVCVVGAGPQALAVVTHLVTARPSLRDEIVVIDPSGEWLQTWQSQFDRLEIGVLRSPSVHHPAVDPGALSQYVADKRLPRSNLPYDPPLTHVFTSFCNSIIESMQLRASVIAARVISLDPADHERTRVTTTAGVFVARQIIWAGSTRTPTVPAPIVELLAASPKIAHGSDVDLPNIGPLDGHHVIVVGGGLTAGHLAVAARARGADVTLVTRRPIVERDFDVEPGWLGPRHLDGYSQLRSPTQRLEVAQTARGGGTMPSWMHRRLELEGSDGGITNVVGEIESIAECGAGLDIRAGGQRINAGHCWLATGTRPDIRADIALGHLVDEHVDGIPVIDSSLRVSGTNVFMTGSLATIELGPAAGNLWGARMAARKICREITGTDLAPDAAAIPTPGAVVSTAERST